MYWYPFDVQQCNIILEMKSTYSPFTNLIVDKFEYLGEKTLRQYEVGVEGDDKCKRQSWDPFISNYIYPNLAWLNSGGPEIRVSES